MTINPTVKVGQVWEDCDPRMKGRQFRIHHLGPRHATVIVTRDREQKCYRPSVGRDFTIAIARFRDGGTRGYRLVAPKEETNA